MFTSYTTLIIFSGIGPVIVARTDDLIELKNFTTHLDGLRDLDHGYDREEFCFDAILKALKANETVGMYTITLLGAGSQIVVFTDAATKRPEIKTEITNFTTVGTSICINFFLSNVAPGISPNNSEDNPFKVYYDLATATNGNVINDYSSWRLAQFLTRSDNESCDSVSRRRKRSAPRQCDTFHVSSLASFFKLAIEASPHSTLTISHPSSADSTTTVGYDSLAIFSMRKPQPGKYKVCSCDTCNISHISFSESVSMDVAFLYLATEKSDGSDVTTIPPACKLCKTFVIKIMYTIMSRTAVIAYTPTNCYFSEVLDGILGGSEEGRHG